MYFISIVQICGNRGPTRVLSIMKLDKAIERYGCPLEGYSRELE